MISHSWRWWATGCVGCIGVLKDWLVDAVAATLIQNGTTLTEAVLAQTMPHPARRLSLEMEARAGEHSIARHDSESAKHFQALVKKPTKVAKEEATRKIALTEGSMKFPGIRSALRLRLITAYVGSNERSGGPLTSEPILRPTTMSRSW